ncbi:MAG TPA: choline/ethanolamine kinase family protein [Thermodesulfobacteriota bacterium]|nr:choline/ethanolamine kinase family protein [Thermodesulfobacteriota bacterium]
MDRAFTVDRCIDLMPELAGLDLDIQELKGGITNRLYRVVSSNGHDYVFRLYGARTELFIDRDVEMENLRRLEPLKVTPKLVTYLPERDLTVVDFIPGYVLKNQDFLREDLWERIIRPIKIIHQSCIQLPYLFDPLIEVKRFYRILEGINPDYPEFDIRGTILLLEKISEVASIPSSRYVPCHNDLLADNFILTDEGGRYKEPVVLIDWEYGGMAPPYYDFADMFQEILVPREVERSLLRVYWEDRDMDSHQYRTDLFKPFPDIYWFLWSLIQLNISTLQFDYYNYGKVKYENARENIDYLRKHYGLGI